jgi:hypothetical protein
MCPASPGHQPDPAIRPRGLSDACGPLFQKQEISEELVMPLYDFEVLKGEEVIAEERSVPLYSPRAAWPKVVALAKGLGSTGYRIRVKERGATIILIGAAAVLRYPHFEFVAAGLGP